MLIFFRKIIIKFLSPATKIFGLLRFSPKARAIGYDDITDMLSIVKEGDVIVTFTKGEASNLLIPGKFKHCGIYNGSGKIIEAIGLGVVSKNIKDFFASKDFVAICRPKNLLDTHKMIALSYCRMQIGKPYDFYFEPGENAFFCAELIQEAYNRALLNKFVFTKRQIMGVMTVLPVDYYLAKDKFEVILERPLR